MSQEVFINDQTELDGFEETDEKGISHQVVWEWVEVAPDMEYEAWYCTTHQRLYYGGCNQMGKPYGR